MVNRKLSRPLALSAAVVLGLGGSFAASPALAAPTTKALTAEALEAVAPEFKSEDSVKLVGRTEDGKLFLGTTGTEDPEKLDAVEELNQELGGKVEIEQKKLDSAPTKFAQSDVVGGAGYASPDPSNPGSVLLCSIGFSGWSPDGDPALITAGHCTDDGNAGAPTRTLPSGDAAVAGNNDNVATMDSSPLGTWGFNQFGGPGNTAGAQGGEDSTDIGVIDVTNPDVELLPEVTDWTSGSSNDLSTATTDITAVGDPQEGEAVERSGRTTGIRTDSTLEVAEIWGNVDGRWVKGFLAEGVEAQQGDSGGAMYQGNTAVGVVSGGGDDENGQPYVIGTRLQDALELTNGYTVALKVDAPTLTDPDDGGDVAAGGDITGEAPAGSTVEVTPQGGQTQEVEVNDDGEWTIEAPATPGTQAYTAVAIKDEFNRSEALNFSVNVTAATTPPTDDPTDEPTETPTDDPTDDPTETPTDDPTESPSEDPSESPSDDPSVPADPTLSIDPERIEASDFVVEDRGVEIVGTGFNEGETVTLTIANGPEGVEGLELTETANAEGVVGFSVYGTNAANPEVYIGRYDVTVAGDETDTQAASFTGGGEAFQANAAAFNADAQDANAAGTADEPLTGSFEVVADGSGDDGNGGGDGDNGGDLPRTGSELTGLAIGGGLLLAGGTALVLSRRKKD